MVRRAFKWVCILLGAVALWIVVLLIASAVVQSRVPVSLPINHSVVRVGDSYVVATGTWVIEGQAQAYPLQTTEIRCEREAGRCTSGTASVMGGETLNVDISFFDIKAWDDGHIVFADDTPLCATYVYTVDVATKSANAVRTKRPDTPKSTELCAGVEKELRLTLRDGFREGLALRKAAMPWFGDLAMVPVRIFQ